MMESKQRRSGRVTMAVPIVVIGSDSEGLVFSEETKTAVLSRHGAGILSRYKLVAEQQLILRVKVTDREAEVRVVGEIARQDGVYTYGVAFVNEALDFWGVEFPPARVWEERPVLALVELVNGDFEYDICVIHGGLARYGKECGLLTVWRQSTELAPKEGPRVTSGGKRVEACEHPFDLLEKQSGAAVKVAVLEERPAATARTSDVVVPLAESVDRRERMRAKVNFFACVRTEKFGEDLVTCIDMSRGGVSFRSKNCYEKGQRVRIAVPFSPESPEAPAIFVPGRIAYAKEFAGGEVWVCGVEFLKG
jgi:hypothetical protein